MVDLSLTPLYFFLGICLLTECVFANQNYNDINTKYINDLCPSDDMQKIVLNTGTRSAIKIKPKKDNITVDYNNCTIIIYSPRSGVILNVDSSAYNHVSFEECDEYIQVFPESKNSSKLCHFKSSSFISEGFMKFSLCRKYDDIPHQKFNVLATSYRKAANGICSPNEFKCDTGECIWKNFRCDGMANCPDGSDEFSSRSSMCITIPHFTLKPIDFDWNLVFPTSKSILAYRKSFNVTVTAAVACAFLIFIFGVIRLVCHYHCAQRNSQRRHHTNLRTFSIIRQRPDFQPQYECPPPPSYVSLINDSSNNTAGGNPPAYSTVISAEENSLTDANKDLKNNAVSGPPPPYEP